MRRVRYLPILFCLLFLLGCLTAETKVWVYQDGSGYYSESVEIPQKLMEFTLTQGQMNSTDDFVAELIEKSFADIDQFSGVRLLDAGVAEMNNEMSRIYYKIGFDSIEQWDAFAKGKNVHNITFSSVPVTPQRGETERREWTVSVTLAGVGIDRLTRGGDESPKPPQMGGQAGDDTQAGSFQLIVGGPQPAANENFTSTTGDDFQAERRPDGAVVFSGALNMLAQKRTYTARFQGVPLSADDLEAGKKIALAGPSENLQRIMKVVYKRREKAMALLDAAGVLGNVRFELKLAIDQNEQVAVSATRSYRGAYAALFARREAALQAMLPEIAANYIVEVRTVTDAEGVEWIAVTRTRRQPLPLSELTGVIETRSDGHDLVYSVQPGRLLSAEAFPEAQANGVGLLIFETPQPVTGSNARIAGPTRVELSLDLIQLRQNISLIVRTNPSGH